MGYIKHNAVIVTCWNEKMLTEAYERAAEIFKKHKTPSGSYVNLISSVTYGVVNSQSSFMIAPDGSKEGWGDSNNANLARKEFLDWLSESENYSDYIEVRFGGDDSSENIIRSKKIDAI